jgi:DNA replication protein DnaC
VVAQRRLARFERYTSRRGRALRQRFSNFILEGACRAATEAFNAALQFAADPHGWLVIYGPTGNGKSHLAAAIANQLLEKRKMPTLFLTVPDFLESLRQQVRESQAGRTGDGYGTLMQVAREVEVLILDDLGAQAITPWAEEVLFRLLDYRYQAELPTVVITNLRPEDLPARLYSRLVDRAFSRVVLNPAPDYRLGTGQVTL